jgi:ribosomal protein S18 acetylase RimI-like enzyme
MSPNSIRNATLSDIAFLTDAVIAAEKSGTETLSYCTIFGLTEIEARKYVAEMFMEEIDGCELSVSSYLVAESENKVVAAVGAWVEGVEGMPSSILKGNLLNYTLPKHCIEKAAGLNHLSKELQLTYIHNSIQIGIVYVHESFRGLGLANILIEEQLRKLKQLSPEINEAYLQVFGNNTAGIRSYKKLDFGIYEEKFSDKAEIETYFPGRHKILMVRKLI